MNKAYDLVVIGSGPGGYVAAIKASQLGLKVAMVERDALGGICLNWGCIPTKALLRSAEILEYFHHASSFGIHAENITPDLPAIIKRSRQIANRLSKGVSFLMKKNSIDVYHGTATFSSPHQVIVQGEEEQIVEAKNILLAVGARARELPFLPYDGKTILSYKDALTLQELPASMAIIGGGAIGVEFAYFYNALGVKVTLLELLPHLLPFGDEEVSEALEKSFTKKGIQVHTGTTVKSGDIKEGNMELLIEKEGKEEKVSVEKVLVAVGVVPNTENIGLENLGVELQKQGFIKVNDQYQTNIPSIFAIGDCIGGALLAHAASQEGIRAVHAIHGDPLPPLDPLKIPSCVYAQPQVASVGYTEKALKEEGIPYKVGKFPYRPNGKALALGEAEGFVKVLVEEKYGELLGCHIIGAESTEMIMEWTLGMEAEVTYQEILSAVHPHPTLHEMIQEAVESAIGKAIHL